MRMRRNQRLPTEEETSIHNNFFPLSDSPTPLYEFFTSLGYYKLHTNPKTWDEAKLICEKEGAHLAIINSKEEVEIVQELRRRLPKIFNNNLDDHVIVGVTDREHEGSWKSIFNQSLSETGYSEWHPNEPNGGTVENCLDLHILSGKFNDFRCNLQLPFVCEKEL
ncbi:Hemolymph lipopolysaccharide-binding protein [Blattella germanica]|nr:Hemolymph lipopolysaccharide-binding protein [Blattella germanica]